jgi:hypothetical protein
LQINPKTLLSHWKKNVSLASRKWRLNLITNLDTFMNEIGKQQISVPLNPEAHRLALEFAKEQHNPQKVRKFTSIPWQSMQFTAISNGYGLTVI